MSEEMNAVKSQAEIPAELKVKPGRLSATFEDVEFLATRGKKVESVPQAQEAIDKMTVNEYVQYIKAKCLATRNQPKSSRYICPDTAEKVQIFLDHPISHADERGSFEFSRGKHVVESDLAGLFLSYKDPITKRPIARLAE